MSPAHKIQWQAKDSLFWHYNPKLPSWILVPLRLLLSHTGTIHLFKIVLEYLMCQIPPVALGKWQMSLLPNWNVDGSQMTKYIITNLLSTVKEHDLYYYDLVYVANHRRVPWERVCEVWHLKISKDEDEYRVAWLIGKREAGTRLRWRCKE